MPAIRRQSSDHSDEPYNPLFSGIKSYFKRVIGWFSNQQTEEEDGQQQTARDQSEFSSLSQHNNQAPPFKFAQSIQFEVCVQVFFCVKIFTVHKNIVAVGRSHPDAFFFMYDQTANFHGLPRHEPQPHKHHKHHHHQQQ